jgi:1-deoxy-D-xylulose-5-phosphate synthase
MFTATMQKHPTFIRYPRGAAEGVAIKDQPALLEVGKAEVLQNFSNSGGKKVALFGLGNMTRLATSAAAILREEGYDTAVINPRFTKPLDEATHEFFSKAADVVITLEDHVLPGGYGSTVMELLGDRGITTPIARIGWPDQFIEHASSVDYLRKKYGLTVERTVQLAREKAGQNMEQAKLQFASA